MKLKPITQEQIWYSALYMEMQLVVTKVVVAYSVLENITAVLNIMNECRLSNQS